MATEFRLPELGENVEQASVAGVLVSAGDTVAVNQPVLEIETDKAVAEIPTTVGGTVKEVRVSVGDKVRVGDVVLVVDEAAAGAKAEAPEPPKPGPKPEAPAKKAAPAPKPAPKAAPVPESAPQPAPQPEAPVARVLRDGPVLASPSVRRLAREHGVDLRQVPVADPHRPVTLGDLEAYLNRVESGEAPAPAQAPAQAPASPAAPGTDGSDAWGPVAHEPMNAIRKKTAEHMAHCWSTIPHVTQFEKIDVTALDGVRKKHGKRVEAAGGKLTVTVFVLKALAEALKRFPRINASIDVEAERVILKQYYNLGVAVDTPNGLLVPVLRDVDRKSVVELAVELPEIAARARDRKLKLEDMQGATFTVTNLGGLGVTAFTPIINAPEVAILGVSRATLEPVFDQGQFVPRLMMPVSLSYDHRVIDGADAARFMSWLKEALEQPWTLFLDHA